VSFLTQRPQSNPFSAVILKQGSFRRESLQPSALASPLTMTCVSMTLTLKPEAPSRHPVCKLTHQVLQIASNFRRKIRFSGGWREASVRSRGKSAGVRKRQLGVTGG
jgi:hypothetical protein